MESAFSYDNIHLPSEDRVSDILDTDCFLIEKVTGDQIKLVSDPVKFSAFTSILVLKGECKAEISLFSYDVKGPALVNIRRNQILVPTEVSPDFEAICVVLSEKLTEALFALSNQMPSFNIAASRPVAPVPEKLLPAFRDFYKRLASLIADTDNLFHFQAIAFAIMQFFCQTGWRVYEGLVRAMPVSGGLISDRFLTLVRENFKRERFLDFYADALEITPKHLSRTIKSQTGVSPVEWIERFVVLEAKVLLKSSRLNIQQISDELNFPSQSFFGKYFKKQTGLSPKEFRNS